MGEGTEFLENAAAVADEEYGEFGERQAKKNKPQFNVKAGGKFVGSGWLGEGKFGKYISLSFREGVATGMKVFLSPRRGFEGILG